MIRSPKVRKMLTDHNIERENITLVVRLKKIVERLNYKVAQQQEAIEMLKRDAKTTKINEMEVEIQHLNDENKRLMLIVDEEQGKCKSAQGSVEKLNPPIPKL